MMQEFIEENIAKLKRLPEADQKDIILDAIDTEIAYLMSDDYADGLHKEISALSRTRDQIEDADDMNQVYTIIHEVLDIHETIRETLDSRD